MGSANVPDPNCVHLGIGNEHKIGAIGRPGFNWEAKSWMKTATL